MIPTVGASVTELQEEGDRLIAVLETEVEAYAALAQDAAQSESDYKREYARAFLAAEGTEVARKSDADEKVGDALFARRRDEALLAGQKEKLNLVKVQIDWVRTATANVRGSV
jgi:hypothetical protein